MLKRILIVLYDAALILGAYTLALNVRYAEAEIWPQMRFFPILLAIRLAGFAAFGLYNWSFRYAGVWEGLQLFKAIVIGSGVFATYLFATKAPLSTLAVVAEGAFTIFLVGGGRFFFRTIPYLGFPRAGGGLRTLIVGAGDAGEAIVREFLRTRGQHFMPVGFVDDDVKKRGLRIHRWRVLGTTEDIPKIVQNEKAEVIVLALPPLPGDRIRAIVSRCQETKKPIKILPELDKIFQEDGKPIQLRDVRIEDLLTRAEIRPHPPLISRFLKGKKVLVTGAAGSIGSELVRQILTYDPEFVVGVDRNENDLYMLYCEVRSSGGVFLPLIGDILHEERLESIFRRHRPEIVFHAAAFKHVPLMQEFPEEAVRNNVLGSYRVAKFAVRFGVERFVNISTDKAVNPTSVMGATKRVGELLLQEFSGNCKTRFSTVRFGNVIGSKGSVVEIFKEQIRRNQPITITHPEMKRYFMTVKEGVCLVLEAGAIATRGEVFMLKMGDEIKIVDLARNLIALHQLVPEKDVPIQFIGVRPGEKLSEELLANEEFYLPTSREHLLQVKLPAPVPGVEREIQEIENSIGKREIDLVSWLSRMVPESRLESHKVKPKTAVREGGMISPTR